MHLNAHYAASAISFILYIVSLVCFLVITENDPKRHKGIEDDSKPHGQGITLRLSSRSFLLRFSTLRTVMHASMLLGWLIDVVKIVLNDISSPLDLPLAFLALFTYRLFFVLALMVSIPDTILLVAAPIFSLSPRHRFVLWIGLLLAESSVYEVMGKGFVGETPQWLTEETQWKKEIAWKWWHNDGAPKDSREKTQ